MAVLGLVMTAGCKEGGPGRAGYVVQPGQTLIRVAIVPFDSQGVSQENAARIVTEEVVTTLLGTGMFDVVEPGMVYAAMAEGGARNAWGLDPATMQGLEEKLGPVSAFVVGTVQEFGEVRVGALTYPSISVSARVLEPQSGRILWAGSCSRTGAETEKLFGMGAVYSSGRLARAVVQQLIKGVDRDKLLAALRAAPTPPETPRVGPRAPSTPGATAGPTGTEKYMNESGAVTDAVLQGYLVDVEGFTKGKVTIRSHHFPIAETTYEAKGEAIAVKLSDCGKKGTALDRVRYEHPGESDTRFAGLPAFRSSSSEAMPGAVHLDVAVGRFALFVTGPTGSKPDLDRVAQTIIDAMK